VAASGWKCFCGTFNTGKFCAECGTEQYCAQDIVCSECSWTAEPGDLSIPVFCPNCGRRFDADDL
jgi:membrane protease subunit (stomatin/prohibitin family)